MEIYALFNSETQVFRSALVQGEDYEEVGDEKWKEAIGNLNEIFKAQEEEWVKISEEDFEKYMQGKSGGENGTGYIRDAESGEAISAPAEKIEVNPGNTPEEKPEVMTPEKYYKEQLEELKEEIIMALLANDEEKVSECREKYKVWQEESKEELGGGE